MSNNERNFVYLLLIIYEGSALWEGRNIWERRNEEKVNRAPLNIQNIWISSHEPRISICDHEDAWLKAWEYLPEFWCDKHVPSFQLSFFEDFS